MLRALALLAALALGSTALAEERCSLDGKQARVADALVIRRNKAGIETEEVDKLDTIWRNKPFEPACAALAVKWLGSDDLHERLAGAAYWLRYRVKRERTTFLIFFTADPGELNPFPVSAEDTQRWATQAGSETSPLVVEAKLDVGNFYALAPARRAQYLIDARAVLPHAPYLVDRLVDTLQQAPDVPAPAEVQALIWKKRGQNETEDYFLDRVLAHQGNPKERALVARILKHANPKTFVDRNGVLENAYLLGLGDLAQPFLLAWVDRDTSRPLCSRLSDAARVAVRHLPTLIELVSRSDPECTLFLQDPLERSLKGAPGLEEKLPELIAASEKAEGDHFALYGTEPLLRALPPDAKVDDFALLAAAISRHHPPYVPTEFEAAVQARMQTATPDDQARLKKLLDDLEVQLSGRAP